MITVQGWREQISYQTFYPVVWFFKKQFRKLPTLPCFYQSASTKKSVSHQSFVMQETILSVAISCFHYLCPQMINNNHDNRPGAEGERPRSAWHHVLEWLKSSVLNSIHTLKQDGHSLLLVKSKPESIRLVNLIVLYVPQNPRLCGYSSSCSKNSASFSTDL